VNQRKLPEISGQLSSLAWILAATFTDGYVTGFGRSAQVKVDHDTS